MFFRSIFFFKFTALLKKKIFYTYWLTHRGVSICATTHATKPVLSRWGIFVAIANNTLYGSKLLIFLLCQKSLGH